jgi:hypothetical protein
LQTHPIKNAAHIWAELVLCVSRSSHTDDNYYSFLSNVAKRTRAANKCARCDLEHGLKNWNNRQDRAILLDAEIFYVVLGRS